MPECIFCEIANKRMKSRVVYEDDNAIGFLDITPRSTGMCLVVPKKHFTFFDEDFELASKTYDAAMIVGKKIKESLQPLTIFFSVMQAQVPHFHIRVYPVYEDQIPLIENKPIELSEKDLDELMEKIKSVSVELEKPEPIAPKEEVKEKPKRKRSEEDLFWLKRHQEVA